MDSILHSAVDHLPLLANMPVPRDLLLPLPLWRGALEICIVLLFLIHILFVNLMVGGSVLTIFFEFLGLKWNKYDHLAEKIATTVTVNKSLAVVLGVGPLLCINLLYTSQFYAANAMTGHAWFALIPLVTIAFLLTYLHKYTWQSWTGEKKGKHLFVGVLATIIFLFIPLIFLSNVNLMLFPDKWAQVKGFFSTLQIGNVFPRYLHFFNACVAITGLFLVGWFGRKSFKIEEVLPEFTRPQLRRIFYHICLWVTVGQFLAGPLLLLTLPSVGITANLYIIIFSGVGVALVVISLLWKEVRSSDDQIGRFFIVIVLLFSVIVLCMGTGRHLYREASLALQNKLISMKTQEFRALEIATNMRIQAGLGAGKALNAAPTGKSVFGNCAACHAYDTVLAAPPLTEVYEIYKDNPQGIVEWAIAPGKKREQFAQMQSFSHLGEDQLMLVAEYMLRIGSGELGLDDPDPSEATQE